MLEREATLAMFIESGSMLIGVAGGMALFADLVEGVPTAFGRFHQFMHIAAPREIRQECTLQALRACAARCHVLSPRLCTVPAFPTLERRRCARASWGKDAEYSRLVQISLVRCVF